MTEYEGEAKSRQRPLKPLKHIRFTYLAALSILAIILSVDLAMLDRQIQQRDNAGVILNARQILSDSIDLIDEDHRRLNGFVETVLAKGDYNTDELLAAISSRLDKIT